MQIISKPFIKKSANESYLLISIDESKLSISSEVHSIRERDERLLLWLLRCKLLNTILPNFRDFTILGDEQSCTP